MAEEDDWTEVPGKQRRQKIPGGGGNDSSRPGVAGGLRGREDRMVMDRKIFVQGLTLSTTSTLLQSGFSRFGRVVEASVCRDADGISRGFGFVTFEDAGTAAMAVQEGGVRIDGKPVSCRLARPREDTQQGPYRDDASMPEARTQVREFVTRNELSTSARFALQRADPKTALRVIRSLESGNRGFTEAQLHSELVRNTGSAVSSELEARASRWVRSCGLSDTWRERVEGLLLGQRPEEIEFVLDPRHSFATEIAKKEDPGRWLLSVVNRCRKNQTDGDIQIFCRRFSFNQGTEDQMRQLAPEKARRLMQSWKPAGQGTQREHQQNFLVLLAQAVKERQKFLEDKQLRNAAAVMNHTRIMEEWSGDEDEEVNVNEEQAEVTRPESGHADCYVLDSGWEGAEADRSKDMAEHFVIHSSTGSSHAAAASSLGSATQQRTKRTRSKPTHFILCVDTSGSMVTQDCKNSEGWPVPRLDAVLAECTRFLKESMEHSTDSYSFVTFNEESMLHFSCLDCYNACYKLEQLHPVAENQTSYSVGIRGIEAAIKRDVRKLPAHVVFLSDGEPTDPGAYLRDLHALLKKHRDNLKIYAIGFGSSAKVNAKEGDFPYLQQLASMGRGHFQRCGASLKSLQGAFTAVSSSISRSRSSLDRRSSADRDVFTGPVESASVDGGGTGATGSRHPTMGALQEEDEASDDGEPANAIPAVNRAAIEFELPEPALIFKDCSNREMWRDFMAAQTSFTFDGRTFSKTASVQRVFLRKRPFMQGGMRLVYGMVRESGVHHPMDNKMCAKRRFQDLQQDSAFQSHSAFCRCTAVARYFADQFRKATRPFGKMRFGFLDCHLYTPLDMNEQGYHFCGEEWLPGHFVKLNSNAGFVNEHEYSQHSAIAQAFSHFTFDQSRGDLLVVDLQGVCSERDGALYSLLTDPQVHSRGSFERFGNGDLQDEGVTAFFKRHVCNDLCKKLKLRKEPDLREPTHVMWMPGVPGCIKHLLFKDFMMDVRQSCKVSSMTVPREPHADWLQIRIWATKRGGQKAQMMLQERLEVFYAKAREVVRVDPAPRWDAARWQSQLDAWRKESNAAVVPCPREWQTSPGLVQELWVFHEPGSHGHQNYALRCIREALAKEEVVPSAASTAVVAEEPVAPTTAAPAAAAATPEASAESWKKYSDKKRGEMYWYREPDGLWFYESDPAWQQYKDEATKRHWWWNGSTGVWFYEPSP